MASGGSDQNAEDALSKLLQMGTVAKYQNKLKVALQIELLRTRPTTLVEAFSLARMTDTRFEDERITTTIANPNELNIAVPDQVLEESTLHTSDKVEVVPTIMVATYEEHGFQESTSGSGISESDISGLVSQLTDAEDEQCRAMEDADALRAELNSLQQQAINGDLGAITSKGGPPNHMQASEKELAVLNSPLEQESMFRFQERMLRRQEQQQLAKEAKIQRRLWDPGIKSVFQDNTLRARWF
ncbi:hypothetical protein Tco_0623125 [Tanacetum coccineum]